MLALIDFRSTAPPVQKRDLVRVRFVCDPLGELPDQLAFGRVDADLNDATAQYVTMERDARVRSAPSRPVGFNLAPGESGTIQLELFSRNQAQSEIQVSVLGRDEQRTETISGTSFSTPALLFAGEMYLVTTDDGLACERIERGRLRKCTVDELRAELDDALPTAGR